MDDEAKQAAALQYRQGQDAAPRVVAAGKGAVAERIIKEGEQHGVPVYKDPDLARLLAALPLGAEIPSDLYAAVAEVLAFVYRLSHRRMETGQR